MIWTIIGGASQGKLDYALKKHKEANEQKGFKASSNYTLPAIWSAVDSADCSHKEAAKLLMDSLNYPILDHLHLAIRSLSKNCEDELFDQHMGNWLKALTEIANDDESIVFIILDDIGSGLVPLDFEDRQWRERCGRIYCQLNSLASRADRVWAGLIQNLKQEVQ